MTDAEVTVEFLMRNAIAGTAQHTGLRAGEASEMLVQELMNEIRRNATVFKEFLATL